MTTDRISPPRPRCRSLMGVKIVGTGSYVPDAVVTNQHLKERLGCDSDWIIKRTGILERRHALPHQATSDLCYEAAQRCLDNAGLAPSELTSFSWRPLRPTWTFRPRLALLQDRLKANQR